MTNYTVLKRGKNEPIVKSILSERTGTIQWSAIKCPPGGGGAQSRLAWLRRGGTAQEMRQPKAKVALATLIRITLHPLDRARTN